MAAVAMATAEARSELDGWLAKTLQLLASSKPDSCQQLRQLLEEAVGAENGAKPKAAAAPTATAAAAAAAAGAAGVAKGNSVAKDAEPEKKKPKLMPASESKVRLVDIFSDPGSSEAALPRTKSKTDVVADEASASESRGQGGAGSVGSSSNSSIWYADPLCCRCGQPGGAQQRRLLECFDCKDLYHLDCHSPPVPPAEVSDPRSLWYCLRCRPKGKLAGSTRPSVQVTTQLDLPVRPSGQEALKAKQLAGNLKIKAAAAADQQQQQPAKKRTKRE